MKYNYEIGYNKTLGINISKQDMIDYHRYKTTVYSDEDKQWHLYMIKKIEKLPNEEIYEI